jgi:site-specific DNA-methyltransferase (cytosine-N4-specific)
LTDVSQSAKLSQIQKSHAKSGTENGHQVIKPAVAYKTRVGTCFRGHAEDVLNSRLSHSFHGKVDLIFTSPPFPLNRKKKYGNLQGTAYTHWLKTFAPIFKKILKPEGSIVIEVGNSWEPGKPVMSTLALESLLAFLKEGKFNLCQQFVWHNPARLPSPAQWVTVERIRLKDSYTHLWWMSPSERPKADNRRVLLKYSQAMKELLKKQSYNSGRRPSEHQIGKESFLKRHRGAIPPSVIKIDHPESEQAEAPPNLITMANTQASSDYQNHCRDNEIEPHPARMPIGLAQFFIKFLTDEGDLVLDPFGGSNTTGAAAETLKRRWSRMPITSTDRTAVSLRS